MTLKPLSLFIGLAVLTGCVSTPPATIDTAAKVPSSSAASNVVSAQSSYTLGVLHIKTLRDGAYSLDQQAYERGLSDALAGKLANEPPTQADWQTLTNLSYAEVKAANLAAGKAFLAHNKTQDGVVTLDSGVQYQILTLGKDAHKPVLSDTVGIVYKISGIDGAVKLDNNVAGKAQKMYEVPLNKIVSKGWQEALQLMTQDSKWRIFIPGELAFGEKGLSERGILPNETLVIETELVSIISPAS